MGREVGLFAGKSRRLAAMISPAATCWPVCSPSLGHGMSNRGQKLTAVVSIDRMADIDGFSQKIPVDFYHLTGKRRRDLGMLIHGFHPAAGILKTIQVQAFMRDGPGP